MCGIAGLFQYRDRHAPPSEHVGRSMIEALSHRGPDDGGLLVADGILLGHRRLSILDLSDEGHQPMSDEARNCWLVFNGEVYNFRELRLELEQAGHHFRSHTDTEVILRGYLQWGRGVTARLQGMFAFGLWDRRENSLWLVRDSLGIKPLFYHDNGMSLSFGSEIKAILAQPDIKREPDWQALDRFLTLGYTPAPWTGFAGIKQLQPGEWLLATTQGTHVERWFQFPYPDRPTTWSLMESADRLRESIEASVQRQMVSDVPLGALLSGGLDSSAVVSGMQRGHTHCTKTFTIGFDDASFDESPHALRVADLFQTSHQSRTISADVAGLLPTIISHAEEPFADNSAIPFFLLSEFVREHVTVALSGDGADELLAGYDTYRASELAPWYRLLPSVLRRSMIAPLVQRLPASRKKYGWPMLLRRFITAAEEPAPRDHCSWRRIVSEELGQQLFRGPLASRFPGKQAIDDYAATLTDAPDWLSPLEQQLHLDLRFHLPNDMLVKVDRMSMAHALEVRVPLLDMEVVRTCLSIPPQHKRQGKRGKLALKAMLEPQLPSDLIHRRKGGFLVPLERWLAEDWQPLLRQSLTEKFCHETGAFHWPTLRQMLDDQATGKADHAYPLFALLVFAIWWRIWITCELPSQARRPHAAELRIQRLTSEGALK